MASILETFLILFETDAKTAEQDMDGATAAADKLAAAIEKVGAVDPTNVQQMDAAIKEAEVAAHQLGEVLGANVQGSAEEIDALAKQIEGTLAGAAEKSGVLTGGLDGAKGSAGLLRDALTDPVGEAAKSTGPLVEGLKDAADQAKNVKDNLPKPPDVAPVGEGFGDWGKRLLAPVAALFTVTSLVGMLRSGVSNIIELTDKASRYNFNVEGYNAFNQIIEDMGGNAQDAERYVRKVSDSVREAYGDMASEPGKVLASLKVNAADAKGNLKDTEQVLLEVAGALEGMNRRAAIDKLRRLGIIDPAMIRLVLQGRDAVEKLMAAEKAKGLITNETAAAVRNMKMAWDDAKDSILTVLNQALGALAPALTAMAQGLETTVKWLRANSTLVQGFGIAMAIAGGVILATFVPAIWAAAAGVLAATWPILLLIAAVAALGAIFALVYEDVMFFLRGQPSLIGDLMAKYKWFADLVKLLGVIFKGLWAAAVATFQGIGTALKVLWDLWVAYALFVWNVWTTLARVVGAVMRTVWAIVGPIIRLIMDIVGALFSIWVQHFQGMLATAQAVFQALWPILQPVFALIMAGLGMLRDFWSGVVDIIGAVWSGLADGIVAMWTSTIDSIIGGVQRAIDWIRKLLGLRSDAEARGEKISADQKAKAGGGAGGRADTVAAVGKGQQAIGAAGRTPLAATPSGAITQGGRGAVTKTNNVKVDKVVVNTQATDADGMAKAAGGALTAELRRTSAQMDDGVEA